MLAPLRILTDGLLQLLYPGMCWVCGGPVASPHERFCAGCRHDLTTDPHPTCPRCAGSVGPFANVQGGCTACRGVALAFDRVLRLGPYHGGPWEEVIPRLKRWSGEGLAEVLGELWAEHAETRLRELGADVVIPVPLHWSRRCWRGYNQSAVLAEALAKRLGLPYRPGWLRRVRATPQQTRQTPAARKTNVRGAFRAHPQAGLRGKTVLLVDDVISTDTSLSSQIPPETFTFTAEDLAA
jgi:predicted amidophosphoribosyltransferase